MAIPKKGSRVITVDGVDYRWRIRAMPTYDQGLADTVMTFAVELAREPASVLVVRTDSSRPDNWVGAPGRAVRPAEVAQSIRAALRQGWRPDQPGSATHQESVDQGIREAAVSWSTVGVVSVCSVRDDDSPGRLERG